jgi:hypothetical protein
VDGENSALECGQHVACASASRWEASLHPLPRTESPGERTAVRADRAPIQTRAERRTRRGKYVCPFSCAVSYYCSMQLLLSTPSKRCLYTFVSQS